MTMAFPLASCRSTAAAAADTARPAAPDTGRTSSPDTCCICGEAPEMCDCGRHYSDVFFQIDGQYYCEECSPYLDYYCGVLLDRPDPQTTVDTDTLPDDLYIGEAVWFGGSVWTVLDIQGSDVLLLSENCVDIRRYDDDSNEWDSSEIKTWLNNEYFDTAFSEEDRASIVDRGQGNVFILSIGEVSNYSVQNGGLYKSIYENGNEDEPPILWWLRPSGSGEEHAAYVSGFGAEILQWIKSPGSGEEHAAYVSGRGNVFENGISVTNECCGVRPAIWIELG